MCSCCGARPIKGGQRSIEVARVVAEEGVPPAAATAGAALRAGALDPTKDSKLLLGIDDVLGIVVTKLDLRSLGRLPSVCRELSEKESITLIKTCTKEIHNKLLVPTEEARRLVSLAQQELESSREEWQVTSIIDKVGEIQAAEKKAAVTVIADKIEETGESASSLMVEGSEKLIEKLNRLDGADLKKLATNEALFDQFKADISEDVNEQIAEVNGGSDTLDLEDADKLDLEAADLTDGQLLRVLMEIDNPAKLTRLNLYNNHLTTLPESIGSLVKLKYLWLDNNQLDPDEPGRIRALLPDCRVYT